MPTLRIASHLRRFGCCFGVRSSYASCGQEHHCHHNRNFSYTIDRSLALGDLSLPTVPECPAPTCPYAKTPQGLDIDRALPLSGSMAVHAEHILVSTGREDWPSRIEDGQEIESPGVGLVKELKTLLGRRGAFANPYHNIMISNSSFAPDVTDPPTSGTALLLPSFLRVSRIAYDQAAVTSFLKGYLLPTRLHASYASVPDAEKQHFVRDMSHRASFQPFTTAVRETVILICSHGSRDERCGVMGPLLRDEFLTQLGNAGLRGESQLSVGPTSADAVVGLVSHIGGHKFAGNVIIYTPPYKPRNRLAGKGVWYGRVEPRHVEGIIRETLQKGNIIRDLFRGGIGPQGETIWL